MENEQSETVYKDSKFSVTDIWLTPDGTSYLAGTLSQGKLRSVIPGKVQVLFSKDFGTSGWNEMKVDYRAVATADPAFGCRRSECVDGHRQRHDSEAHSG